MIDSGVAVKAERGVLGSILLDGARVLPLAIVAGMETQAFSAHEHQMVWRVCVWLHGSEKAIDVLTVGETLRLHGQIEGVGGLGYLNGLIDDTPTAAHSETYIEQVMDAWIARRLVTSNEQAVHDLGTRDVRDVIADQIHELSKLAVKGGRSNTTVAATWDRVKANALAARDGKILGVPSPWPTFTEYTGGARFGAVTLVIGRSKTRKSYLAHQWGLHASVEMGIPGAYYPLEDGQEVALTRAACCIAGFDSWAFEHGRFTDDEMREVENASDRIRKSPYDIRSGVGLSLPQWRLDIARGVADEGHKFITIDAFKDLTDSGGDVQTDAKTFRWLHGMAVEFDIAIIVVQHVKKNRTQNRPEKDKQWQRLIKEDARGSSFIADSARLIIALQCEWMRDDKGVSQFRHYVLDCIANSYGRTAAVSLDLDEQTGVFTENIGRAAFSDWEDEKPKRWGRKPADVKESGAEDAYWSQ